jgi:PTH1 family peptidyl-tRNA hydrolase
MEDKHIKAIIGLGNPGPKFRYHRHNIGFLVVDALVERAGGTWQHKDLFDLAEIQLGGKKIYCLKPLTFMNASGKVIPFLQKQGIAPEQILVVHDELEKPFGAVSVKCGGSARGHNGLRSIIGVCGDQFYRLRFGIGRPERKEDVPDWVLTDFSEPKQELASLIEKAADLAEREIA